MSLRPLPYPVTLIPSQRAQRYNQLFQNLLRTMVFDPRHQGDNLADLGSPLDVILVITSADDVSPSSEEPQAEQVDQQRGR